jgi:hypothetical protein
MQNSKPETKHALLRASRAIRQRLGRGVDASPNSVLCVNAILFVSKFGFSSFVSNFELRISNLISSVAALVLDVGNHATNRFLAPYLGDLAALNYFVSLIKH